MRFSTLPSRFLSRRAVPLVVATAALLGAVPAAATVVSTPGGEVAVATSGEYASGRYLAVSNGGDANSSFGVAASTTGRASAWGAAFSATGCATTAYNALAVSGTGCADAADLSVSGTGDAGRNNPSGAPGIAGISGTGCAGGMEVALSVAGCASGPLALSALGNASAPGTASLPYVGPAPGVAASGAGSSSGAVAVSGGQANGSMVGVTGWGDASGSVASVDGDREIGSANGTAWDTLRDRGVYHNLGINLTNSAYQAWVIATSAPPDTASYQQKVAAYQATLLSLTAGVPPAPPSAPSSAPASSVSIWWPVWPMDGWADYTGITDDYPNSCAPASAYTTYQHRGMPSYAQLTHEMGVTKAHGTTLANAATVIQRHYVGPSQPVAASSRDYVDLNTKVMTAINHWGQGVIVAVALEDLWWYYNYEDARPTPGRHALSVWGYQISGYQTGDNNLVVWDSNQHPNGPYNTYDWQPGGGIAGITANELTTAMSSFDTNIIW